MSEAHRPDQVLQQQPDSIPSRALRCPICDAAARHPRAIHVQDVRVVRCGSCSHEFTPHGCGMSPGIEPSEPTAWRPVQRAVQHLLGLRFFGATSGKLLCLDDDGVFERVASVGPFEVTAPPRIAPAKGDAVPAWLDVLEHAGLEEEGFDAATVWSGLDREPDPVGLLARLRQLVRPGGLVALSTPITGSAAQQRDPLAWEGYRFEGARHYFSRGSLRVAAGRAGLDVRGIVPAALRPDAPGLPPVDRIVARAGVVVLDALAPDARYARRGAFEILWRAANAAELWLTRPGFTDV